MSQSIRVSIRYFASIREQCGRAAEDWHCAPDLSVGQLWEAVAEKHALRPDTVLMAVNQTYVKPDHPVSEGDEVAFFPPVTGG